MFVYTLADWSQQWKAKLYNALYTYNRSNRLLFTIESTNVFGSLSYTYYYKIVLLRAPYSRKRKRSRVKETLDMTTAGPVHHLGRVSLKLSIDTARALSILPTYTCIYSIWIVQCMTQINFIPAIFGEKLHTRISSFCIELAGGLVSGTLMYRINRTDCCQINHELHSISLQICICVCSSFLFDLFWSEILQNDERHFAIDYLYIIEWRRCEDITVGQRRPI